MKFHKPSDETKIETEYRLMREDVQNWNQSYWAKHNSNFVQVWALTDIVLHVRIVGIYVVGDFSVIELLIIIMHYLFVCTRCATHTIK